jgi:endonuclease/exonuclease/phosphatase family metal-dependent hydrolase
MRQLREIAFWLFIFGCFGCVQRTDASSRTSNPPTVGPALLSFDELTALSSTAKPQEPLATRLDVLLNTPFLNNGAEADGTQPRRPVVNGLGPVLRVCFWNIERGLEFDLIRSALTSPEEYRRVAGNQMQANHGKQRSINSQLAFIRDADILVLDEVDVGMKRTDYRDVAGELAASLHMNYAYGVEFIEVDPIFDLGTEQIHLPDPQLDRQLQRDLQVDRGRYLGLHGTAILSRYPIRNPNIFRLPVCYDWYGQEVKGASKLEMGRRWSAHKLFRERIGREIRHGGRMALIAEIEVPELPGGSVTVVAPHLENKCSPACRRKQMTALLSQIQPDKKPVIIAGDFNTTSSTNTPTSIRNEIMTRVTDYKFWAKQAVSYFHPLGIFKYALLPVKYVHGYNDPTAFHVPILWDNEERPLFKTIEKFRFADQRAFDFRGLPQNTSPPRKSTLSDSNARAGKGFVPTYAFARDFGGLVGRYKLDWVFVKPFIQDPRGKGQNNRFSPHFPGTMRDLNESVVDRISDHAPLVVDLPLRDVP